MQLAINNHKSSPFDKWTVRTLFNLSKGLLTLNENLFNFFKSILGLIGLIIAIPLLFVLSIIGWIFMLSLNYRIERDLTDYNTLINAWDDRKKIEEHLSLEKAVKRLNGLMKQANSKKFIINPVTKQTIIFAENLSQMEQTLKRAAYPNIDKPITKEETEYLISVFERSDCEDWKHESAISYED